MCANHSEAETQYTPRWARNVARLGAPPFGGRPPTGLSLAYGFPDPTLFPTEEIARAVAGLVDEPSRAAAALQYGPVAGRPEMLLMLANKLHEDEGLSVEPANLLVTNGALQAISLAARALVDEGDAVLVEAPSFMGAMHTFRTVGAQLFGVPMGDEGIDIAGMEGVVDALHVRGVRPRVLYTMPTFHNPTGLTMPEAQRGALLALAHRYDLTIIEDDAYRDLYYDASQRGPLPPSLYALDHEGRVIRTGTFSKILAPGLRLGYALARPETIRRLMLLKDEGATAPFSQYVAFEYARGGALKEHIERLVEIYRLKRDRMLDALQRHFPIEARWTHPAGGFYVWITLPPTIDPNLLTELAREEDVDYVPGETCFCEPPASPGTYLRLSFSALTLDDIEEAVKRLGRVVKSLM